MTIRWVFAALHLLALGIGLGAIWGRRRAFLGPLDDRGLDRLFYADSMWGMAALLWILTGLARAFGGLGKGTAYYLASDSFIIKMALFVLILVLEISPMMTLIRWRSARKRGASIDTSRARSFATISTIQALLLAAMVLAATAIARGLGVDLF
jgi:putative membrane protein